MFKKKQLYKKKYPNKNQQSLVSFIFSLKK